MNSASKIVALVLAVFMVAYVAYQSYQFFYNPYETEIVLKEQYLEDLELNGFFVRDEMVFPEQRQGVVGYHYDNAEKVSKGAAVASIYGRQSDLYNLREAEKLEELRDTLLQAQDAGAMQGVKLDLLVKQITESKMALIKNADDDDYTKLNETYRTLMSRMDRLELYVDATTDYSGTIASLDSQINTLRSGISETGNTVSSPDSGYFSSTADGYEAAFTPDMLERMTVSDMEQALKRQPDAAVSSSVGKLVREADWSFAALITAKQAELFTEGQTLSLKFSSSSTREVPVTVTRVSAEEETGKAVLVLSGDYLDKDFVTMRFEKPRAVVRDFTGIIIPKEAIRIRAETDEEGNSSDVRGVYVRVGTAVRFRKIEALYEDDYVVVSKIVNQSDYVAIYDEVIIKGKDLNAAAG